MKAALLPAFLLPAALLAPAAGRCADLPRLIDRVVADPGSVSAHEELGAEAGKAVARQRKAWQEERTRLMREAAAAKAARDGMEEEKNGRLARWNADFSAACSMASRPDTVKEAVSAYERLLTVFPVYSGAEKTLEDSDRRIMGIFFRTIKRSYPYLAEGREAADARMLAALVFSRVSEKQSEFGGAPPSGMTEAQLRKAEKLDSLERVIRARLSDLNEALSLYGREHWGESVKYLDAVLAFDKGNEEALYYRDLALARSGGRAKR